MHHLDFALDVSNAFFNFKDLCQGTFPNRLRLESLFFALEFKRIDFLFQTLLPRISSIVLAFWGYAISLQALTRFQNAHATDRRRYVVANENA
jgi:hypothetical protein